MVFKYVLAFVTKYQLSVVKIFIIQDPIRKYPIRSSLYPPDPIRKKYGIKYFNFSKINACSLAYEFGDFKFIYTYV